MSQHLFTKQPDRKLCYLFRIYDLQSPAGRGRDLIKNKINNISIYSFYLSGVNGWLCFSIRQQTLMPPQHLNELHSWWVRINQLLFCASKVPSDILAGSYLSHSAHLIPPRWPTGPSSGGLWMTWTWWRSANRLRDCISPSRWWLLEPHILRHQSSLYFLCMIKYWSLRIIVNSRSEPKLNQKVENKSILGHLESDNSGSPEGGG